MSPAPSSYSGASKPKGANYDEPSIAGALDAPKAGGAASFDSDALLVPSGPPPKAQGGDRSIGPLADLCLFSYDPAGLA